MKFIGFTMVKNEEDIIEQFVRHNLEYLDAIYIFDHYSTDMTRIIIKAISDEGLPVYLLDNIDNSDISYKQAEIMTGVFRHILRIHGASVYFPLDADEFIYIKSGNYSDIKKSIIERGGNTFFEIFWDCLMIPQNPGEEYFLDPPRSFNIVQYSEPRTAIKKVILSILNPEIGEKIIIAQGNHSVCHENVLEKISINGLSYLHAPIRSADQMFRKAICGWLANVHRFGTKSVIGNHWGSMFHQICTHGNLTHNDIIDALVHYSDSQADESRLHNIKDKNIFNYKTKYSSIRSNSMSVVLKDLEARFEALHHSASKEVTETPADNLSIFNNKLTISIGGVGDIVIFPGKYRGENAMSQEISKNGKFEIFSTSILVRIIKMSSGDLIDIGADVGWYTYICAKIMPERNVYSFEVDDGKYSALSMGVGMNSLKNVKAVRSSDGNSIASYFSDLSKFNENTKIIGNISTIRIFGNANDYIGVCKILNSIAIYGCNLAILIGGDFFKSASSHGNFEELASFLQKDHRECFIIKEEENVVRTVDEDFWENSDNWNKGEKFSWNNLVCLTKGSPHHSFLKGLVAP